MTEPMNESEVRSLRDKLYGQCSDHNWNECKHKWMTMENQIWLSERVANDKLSLYAKVD